MAFDKNVFRDIDRYIEELFVPPDKALSAALADSEAAGLPHINVSPNLGHLLYLLARLANAKRILEVGLLGGYSTIWLARAAQAAGGEVISLELEEKHARVARKNLERAKVLKSVDIRVGPAAELMQQMIDQRGALFDVIFIDADKASYPEYLEKSLKLVHSGSLIVADNVIRNGRVLESGGDADMVAVKKFNKMLAQNARLEGMLLPIIRENLDGIAIARVK